jgi:hypothetical protein
MFGVLAEFITRLAENGALDNKAVRLLVKEWQDLAGTATLNPTSELGMQINHFTLKLMLNQRDEKAWEQAVAGAGQVARLAILRSGVKDGFSALVPLFDIGRELLAMELKFGSAENAESFRQRALYAIVKECLALADFAARQDFVTTVGDVITEFYRQWLARPGNPGKKAVKRFCQLLVAYWIRTRARQARNAGISNELAAPALLSDTDKQRLGFLL